jgi:myo-inositol 2-dehydrogenase/D-chiro-inositol 1-dehydrogenase
MTHPPIRFGLIGYGLFGAHHARAIAAAPGAELRAIAVPSETSQQAARAAHPGATIYSDFADLLARDDIDAVDVVIPNRWHYEVGRAVLMSERHLLLEKPMALTLAQCDELVGLAAKHDLVLAVGHELRVSSLWGGVKKLIDDGAIGQPRAALVELSRFPYRQGSGGWRYERGSVGSWILEEPIHFFDLARWYMSGSGDPVSVYARASARDAARGDLHDHFTATIGFADDSYAVIVQTLSAFGHHQTVKVSGTKGTIWAQWSASDARSPKPVFSLRHGLGDVIQELTFEKPTGELLELADEIVAFTHAIREGQPPPCTGNDGRWSTMLCLAAEESVRRKEEVLMGDYVAAFGMSPQASG